MRGPRWLIRRFWAPAGRWPRVVLACACAVVLAMYVTDRDMGGDPDTPRGDGHYRPVLARGDGHMLYLMARSTALDLDWNFDNDLARFGDPWNEPRTATGRKGIVHPIGPALVWTPLIWIAEAGAAVVDVFGAGVPLHGYTLWHQRFVFLSSALFGIAAVLLGRKLARQTFGARWASTHAATGVLLGTSLTYYTTYMPSYSHAMDACACAAFLYAWARTLGRTDLRRWITLGVLLGIAALVREQDSALGVVVAFEVVVRIVDALRRVEDPWLPEARRWLAGGAITLAVSLVVFTPQLLEWHVVFGSARGLPQGARFTRFSAPMIPELLWSARNGWFSSTPLAYAGCIGLVVLAWRHRMLGGGLLAAVATQVYLSSTVLDWWSGASFGQRRLCDLTLPLVVGLAYLVHACGRLVARRGRLARSLSHGAAIIVLGGFITSNLSRIAKLYGGKPAPDGVVPTCCGDVPAPLRGAASWLYERVGNPFELPASAVFAIEHGVPLSRWDQTVGNYPLQPALADVRDDAHFFRVRGTWRIGDPGLEPYLAGGWSASRRGEGRVFRVTTARHAVVLVPNMVPDGQRLTLWLGHGGGAEVRISWNGAVVATARIGDAWTRVTFDLPHIALHTNELAVDSPTPVAVGDLELALLR